MVTRAVLLYVLATGLCLSAEVVSFRSQVQPILASRCAMCHPKVEALLTKSVTPGRPDESLLVHMISGDGPNMPPKMPKTGAPLTGVQIATIRQWIEQGAKNDSDGKGEPVWWSLRPLKATGPPPSSDPWVLTPVDVFILSTLREKKLTPSREADRRTLIRRVYFDLHGLPPSAAEIDAFIADSSPESYEKLVDRLLASPRYGERWARHWLDVIHYGDSHGYDKDKPRANAWPYRDYVIHAFNSDKPYARFVREQLAGDVLYPDSPEAFVATGFLAAGPWDFVGHQELREGTVEKLNTRLLDRDDIVATTMSTFVSTTAHCARCHDHKFDPIPQAEYYNLQSVFAGIDRADRPWDAESAVHVKRQQLMQQKLSVQMRLQVLLDKVEFASSPEIVKLDDSIQDAKLLIVHMGVPKTPAETDEKARLQARLAADQERRRSLVDAIVGKDTYAGIERIREEMKGLDAQVALLPPPHFIYSGTAYFDRVGTFRPALQPRPVFVLSRGSVQAPKEAAVPGALRSVPGLEPSWPKAAGEGERRASLANWIADDRNVLTWRSIVNRVWQDHFGSGIVDSASDFGRMGSKPTHPELLDWLAVWFRDEAHGSIKKLHKLILMSSVYRQSSANRTDAEAVDGDNRLLWRMNRSRLDAESVRDAVLAVAGKLDLSMGGPAVRMFAFKDDHSPVYDYAKYDPDAPGAHRRSIYRFIVRSVPDPFMERLDCPDPSVLTPKRSTTITAIQALAMLNNPFVTRMSGHLAERVQKTDSNRGAQVREAVRLTLGRTPVGDEQQMYEEYSAKYGLESLCRVLFNTNEFLFVD